MKLDKCINLWFVGLVFVLASLPVDLHANSWSTQNYVEVALENNNQLASLDAKVRETYRTIDSAGSLDNPRLQAGLMNLPVDSYAFDEQAMTSKDLAVVQKIPFYGKLDQRTKQAVARHRITRAERDVYRTKLAHDVRSVLFERWKLGRLIELSQEERNRLQSFVDITRSRYESGKGIQADLRRAESRLSRVEDRLLQLKQQRRSSEDRLRRLVGGETLPKSSEYSPDFPKTPSVDIQRLQSVLPERSPRLRADSEQIRAVRHGVQLAELDYYPDVDLGVRYRQREDREDFASVSITVPLPIWASRKERAELESRRNRLERFQKRYEDRRDEQEYRLRNAWNESERLRLQRALYKNRVIPQARDTLESSLSAYRVGKVQFVSLLDAELEWFRAESEYLRIRSESATTHSQLAKILGSVPMKGWSP